MPAWQLTADCIRNSFRSSGKRRLFLTGTREEEKTALLQALTGDRIPFPQQCAGHEDTFAVDLDQPFGSAGCVIMASGLGKRFGGNKLMEPFRGKPMIVHILDATDGLFEKRVVVTRHETVAGLARERGIEVILHNLPHRSDTVRLGLEAVGGVARCMFCPGDQPMLRRETVISLLLCGADRPQDIHRTGSAEAPGAPILFPQWIFPELRSLPEGKGGSFAARNHPGQVRFLPVEDPRELQDIDSPEDLRRLEER